MTVPLSAAATGLLFGLGLIVAIGAQNVWVLRQGLRREHVPLVVGVCALSDLLLIAAGTAGLGALVLRHHAVLTAATLAGVVVLVVYAVQAARRAARPATLVADPGGSAVGVASVAGTTLALTWLNPHVYLDTVVLLGSVAATYGDARWWFAGGAGLASVGWFSALGFGATLLRPVFARPGAWRVFDAGVAVVLLIVAAGLVTGLVT